MLNGGVPTPPRIILVMGVAGSGKTTIGRSLAAELGWPYFEADSFHSPASRAKMTGGTPLTDGDRAPWLAAIRARMDECRSHRRNAVFTCSALKDAYRRVLLEGADDVGLVYLAGDYQTILARVSHRQGHYLKAGLVRSQFDTLEPPRDALAINTGKNPPAAVIAQIRQTFGL